MRALTRRSILLVAALAAAILPGTAAGPTAAAPGKLRILTTIYPLQQFAAAVVGTRGEASLLLPPGAGVHTWQPRPEDIVRLSECDLLIYLGAGLEPWLPDMLKAFPKGRLTTLEAGAGLAVADTDEEGPGHAHGAEGLDPHIWLDLSLDQRIVERIAAALTRIDPSGGPEFAANAGVLDARLAALDAEFRAGLSDCRDRDIVLAGHAAFGYLARRYGLRQISLFGLSPDALPSARDLMRIVDLCRKRGIRTVYLENSVPADLSQTLAREIGGRVLVLQTGHNLTREDQEKGVTFFDLMKEDLAALRQGLGCR
jgi:zinc transport system substrate-binding protein